jgi:WD40 repeat protein
VIDANVEPILQLDTGAHWRQGALLSADGKQLVSASDDMTIRVWDWQSGKTVRIIRGNVGASHEGKYFSMALSPMAAGSRRVAGCWRVRGPLRRNPPVRLLTGRLGRYSARAMSAW